MNNPSKEKINITKTINKNVYLLLALMIFLGFFQIFIFYQNFDIGVYNYSSPLELLFFFIPSNIITPIKVIIGILNNPIIQIFTVMVTLLYFIDLCFNKSIIYNICKLLLSLWNDPDKIIKNMKLYRLLRFFYLLFTTIYILFISYFIIRLMYILMAFKDFPELDYYITYNFIRSGGEYNIFFRYLYLLWGIILFIRLFKYLKTINKLQTTKQIFNFFLILMIIFLFTFDSLKTTHKVAELKKQRPIQDVEFLYDSIKISTNDSNVYIGSTKDYLFIRNFNTGENKLYNVNNVKYLKTRLR